MNNLYGVLGVDRAASADDIKRRFRTLSKVHHPDRGGDATAFDGLKKAYDVLSHPGKRAHYDRYGQKPEYSQAMDHLHHSLVEIVKQISRQKVDIDHCDYLSAVVELIDKNRAEAQAMIESIRFNQLLMRKVAGRLATNDGYDYVALMFEQHQKVADQEIEGLEIQVRSMTLAIELAAAYTDRAMRAE